MSVARWIIAGLAAFSAISFAYSASLPGNPDERPEKPPVLAQIADGGQLICDPIGHAAGYQPPGQPIYALNASARARIAHTSGLWIDIPISFRANTDPRVIDSLRRRAESLC